VSAADPDSGGAAASGGVGGAPVLALAIDPDTPTTLYAGTYCFGVFKSFDGGDSWSAVNTGLPSTSVSALGIHLTTPTTLYAATDDDVFKSLNGGSGWQATGLTDRYVPALAIDPTTPTTLYAGTNGDGLFKSLNGGSSWSAVNTGLPSGAILALAINPTTPTTLYAGTWDGGQGTGGVFRSPNAGSSWSAVNTGLTSRYVSALAINPRMPTTLYAGGDGLFQSTNGGGSWQATGLTDRYVSTLAINPTTPTTLYYAGGDGLFRSTNGGGSWSEVTAGLTNRDVRALAIDPTTPTTLYAGTVGGVFRSLNGGSSWEATGLAGVMCGDGVVVCGGWEQCDDGGESATCDADCTLAECGDGTLNVTAGEQCDDGNRNPFDGCTNECAVCGDGMVTPPEECDGGNTPSGDDCDAQCRRPHVVGTGTPESCTEAAFEARLAERSVSFDCGPAPVTITLTSAKAIRAATTVDGGGRITLSGGGAVPVFWVYDDGAVLDVRNLTIADGHTACTPRPHCSPSVTRGLRTARAEDRQETSDRGRRVSAGVATARPLARRARRCSGCGGLRNIPRTYRSRLDDSHDRPHRPLRVPASYVPAPRASQRGNVSRVWQRSITLRTNHNLVTVPTRTRTNSRLVNRHETSRQSLDGAGGNRRQNGVYVHAARVGYPQRGLGAPGGPRQGPRSWARRARYAPLWITHERSEHARRIHRATADGFSSSRERTSEGTLPSGRRGDLYDFEIHASF
jgi:cysteine-rich repeat protein